MPSVEGYNMLLDEKEARLAQLRQEQEQSRTDERLGWAEDLLDDRQMQQDGYLRPEPVRKMWADHLAGDRDWGSYLWTVLMFQSWMRHWMRGDVRKPRTSQLVLQ